MSSYRRMRVTGGTYFFTVALAHRGSDLLVREIGLLREAVRVTRSERPFEIDAWVVLPDHLHCLWTLPAGDADYSTRWGAIKARFTRAVKSGYGTDFNPPLPTELPVVQSGRYAGLKPGIRVEKRESAIWQRRFWEHTIRDAFDYRDHITHCWRNPVKHGLVARPSAWPYSSIHRDIRLGRVPPEWT